jgi:chitinase
MAGILQRAEVYELWFGSSTICSSQFAGLIHDLEARSFFMRRFSLSLAGVLGFSLMSLLAPSAFAQAACAPSWQIGISITTGEVLSFNGDNWQALQPETQTVDGWQPPNVPALWKDLGACSGSGGSGGGSCSSSPSAPGGLSASATTSSGTTLSWSAVTPPASCSITSYSVFENGSLIGTTSGTSFTVSGLAASTTYSFTVAASDSVGSSPQSSVSVTTSSSGGGGGGGSCGSGIPNWAPSVTYAAGALVMYNAVEYKCILAHTSEVGWEPPNVPALWQSVSNPCADFSLTATPSTQTAPAGYSTTYTVTVTALSGFTGTVALEASGLPSGATATFSPASVTTSGTAALTITTASSTPVGSSTVAITGTGTATSGSLTHSATVTLVTNPPKPDFVNSVTPASETVIAGRSGSYTVTITAEDGFTGSISLSASGLPSGATATFNPASVSGSGASVLTISTSGSTPDGTYALTVIGTSGSLTHTAGADLQVSPIPTGFSRLGYFPQWGIYGRGYYVNDLITTGAINKLTHVIYAFENIDPTNLTCLSGVVQSIGSDPEGVDQGTGAGDAYADYGDPFASNTVGGQPDTYNEPIVGNFNQLKKLKAAYPNVQILVSLGGWTYSKFFSDVAATDASRKKFVSSCIDVYMNGNIPVYGGFGGPGTGAGIFDGFDIDWEWPGGNFGHPGNHYNTAADKENLVLLLQEFRTELDALGTGHHPLTAFAPADPVKLAAGWDLTQLASILDYFDVQGYDFHGAGSDNSWEPDITGNSSQLYQPPSDPHPNDFTVDGAIQMYLKAGVDSRLVNMGLPFYGHGWQGVAANADNGDWSTANGAACGQFGCDINDANTWNTDGPPPQITLAAAVPGCTQYYDPVAVATSCFTGNGGQFWSYDDPVSLTAKMGYVKNFNLGGIFIWDMSGDNGPLMTAIDTGLK